MSFAVPGALAFSLIALPIVIFYILKVRLRQVPVSTNMFWKQIFDEKPPRSIWQKFRHLLSLLAQLLLLGLMVFALADPYFSWQALKAKRIVLVIDNSASMKATDVSPNRFSAAVDRAIELADGLRFRDEMAIVLAGSRPDVVLGMSGHIPTLKESIRTIKVSDNPTELDSAIDLAKQLVGDHPNGEVVVLTDGCAEIAKAETSVANADDTETKESNTTISWQIFATEASNVGITKFQVRRSLIDMLGYEVLASVTNASENQINCRLEISLSDAVVDVIPLELEPGETWTRSIEKTSREGGILSAAITRIRDGSTEKEPKDEDSDAVQKLELLNSLVDDDRAWAILPTQKVQNVLIVTEGNLFLRKVFEANPLVNVTTVPEFPEKWPDETLVVLHRMIPKTLPANDVFVVDPIEDCDQWTIAESIENPIVTEIDSESDLMTHVRLDNVVLPEAKSIDFKNDPKILAGTISKEPVYAQLQRPGGRCLLLSVDLDKSDLAFRTTFPIMVTNALNWFVSSSGDLRESSNTGDLVLWQIDPNTFEGGTAVLQNPEGQDTTIANFVGKKEIAPDNDELTVGPFDQCGIWALGSQIETKSAQGKEPVELVSNFAVNIANERETDLRPTESMLEQSEETTSLSGWFGKPVWYYLVAAAAMLFVTEWLLHQRRVLT